MLVEIRLLRGCDHDSTETHLQATYKEELHSGKLVPNHDKALLKYFVQLDKTDIPVRLYMIAASLPRVSSLLQHSCDWSAIGKTLAKPPIRPV